MSFKEPYIKEDVGDLERAQRRMIQGLDNMTHTKTLTDIGLFIPYKVR